MPISKGYLSDMRHLLGSGRLKDHSFTVAVFKHVFRFFSLLRQMWSTLCSFLKKKKANEGVLDPS